MAYSDDARILVKIAHMYYEDGATQAQIAEVLGVSRPLISKYLAKARETGIVEIHISDETAHPYLSLESALERKYRVREVIVVPDVGEQSVKRQLGLATSNYLVRILKNDQIVGLSSGTTLFEVVNQMPKLSLKSATIVPLVGGLGYERVDIHANRLVATMATRLDAQYKLLHVPVAVDSVEAKQLFLQQSAIADIMELGRSACVAVVGIGGAPEYSTMVKYYMGGQGLNDGAYSEVVGDICFNFINAQGQAPNVSWNERVIALSLDDLKRIPTVIGVAHGEEKILAIHGALTEALIDVLVTDYRTAMSLLDGPQ